MLIDKLLINQVELFLDNLLSCIPINRFLVSRNMFLVCLYD